MINLYQNIQGKTRGGVTQLSLTKKLLVGKIWGEDKKQEYWVIEHRQCLKFFHKNYTCHNKWKLFYKFNVFEY